MPDDEPVETIDDVVAKFSVVSDDELARAVDAVKAKAYDHVVTIGRYNAELQQLQEQLKEWHAKLAALLHLQEERTARAALPTREARRAARPRPVKKAAAKARKRR